MSNKDFLGLFGLSHSTSPIHSCNTNRTMAAGGHAAWPKLPLLESRPIILWYRSSKIMDVSPAASIHQAIRQQSMTNM